MVKVEEVYARLRPEFGEDVTQEVLAAVVEEGSLASARGLGYFVTKARWVRDAAWRRTRRERELPVTGSQTARPAQGPRAELREVLLTCPGSVIDAILLGTREAATIWAVQAGALRNRVARWRKESRGR